MLKKAGFAILTVLVLSPSTPASAQQPQLAVQPTVSGKPAPKKATRGIVIEKSAEDTAPTTSVVPPADEPKVVTKPAAPTTTAAKPADISPRPLAEKPDGADKAAPAVNKPVLKEKPVVRAKPRSQRPRYGHGGYY